jgi:hypothetical protein
MARVRLLDQELNEQPQMDEEGIDSCDPQAGRKTASSTYCGNSAITFNECAT